MAPQASKQGSLLPPDHTRIGSCTSNGLNSEEVPGTFSVCPVAGMYWSPSPLGGDREVLR